MDSKFIFTMLIQFIAQLLNTIGFFFFIKEVLGFKYIDHSLYADIESIADSYDIRSKVVFMMNSVIF